MKKVGRFNSHTTAHLAKEALLNRGIVAEIIGSRDYSSIIVGGDQGRYDLTVDWKDEAEALKIIKGFDVAEADSTEPTPPPAAFSLLRKAIVMGLLAAVFIPIVFNYASLKNLAQYLKLEPSSTKRWLASVLVIGLQFLTIAILYYALKTMTTDIPMMNIDELN